MQKRQVFILCLFWLLLTHQFSINQEFLPRLVYVFRIIQFARNIDLILTILLKWSFSSIVIPRSLIFKNVNVNSPLFVNS